MQTQPIINREVGHETCMVISPPIVGRIFVLIGFEPTSLSSTPQNPPETQPLHHGPRYPANPEPVFAKVSSDKQDGWFHIHSTSCAAASCVAQPGPGR